MPGKSDAKIIADFLVEKGVDSVSEAVTEQAIVLAADFLGGGGAFTAAYHAYKHYKVRCQSVFSPPPLSLPLSTAPERLIVQPMPHYRCADRGG